MNVRYEETQFDLYVPAANANTGIDPGSAIVAPVTERGKERIFVHFEGNRFGAENMRRYDERCLHAAGRAATRYPTIARASIGADNLVFVGTYDLVKMAVMTLDNPEPLQAWIGTEPLPTLA